MNRSDAGKLGYIKAKQTIEENYNDRVNNYYINPKHCLYCNCVIPYDKRYNKFCCKNHAASYNNKHRDHSIYENISNLLKNKSIAPNKNKTKRNTCKICGALRGECKDSYVCSKYRLFNGLIKFGFDINTKGTEKIIDEFYRVRNIIEKFYLLNGSNNDKLIETFNYYGGPSNFHKILKTLDIQTRNLSEGQIFSLESGNRIDMPQVNSYHDEYHKTWDNNIVYLRSSYETDYANILDDNKIHYEVESLKIKYFDTQLNKERIAIPDFYIKDKNLIVEIKSNFTLDIQNMKDKVISYKNNGYNFKLILEHKEVDLYSL